jgi:Fe2+ or Zn2+ uptake regulation protein
MAADPSPYFDHLQKRGQALTPTVRGVIEALAASRFTAYLREVHASGGPPALVKVYRVLQGLVQMGIAREVPAGPGGERLELVELR